MNYCWGCIFQPLNLMRMRMIVFVARSWYFINALRSHNLFIWLLEAEVKTSISANNVTITSMVINTIPNNGMALLPMAILGMVPAKDTSWAKMHLAQGNKFPEEKSDLASNLMGNTLKTEGEDKQQSDNVMQKVGTSAKYPVPSQEPLIQSDDASAALLSQSTHPAVQAKRNCRQVLLDLLYHFVVTRNLAGIYCLRQSEELNWALCNMIEMAILEILWSRQTSRSNNCYLTRAVMSDWLLANFNKVKLWQLVQEETDIYQLVLDKRNSDALKLELKRSAVPIFIANLKGH